jgi:hypothetical protein
MKRLIAALAMTALALGCSGAAPKRQPERNAAQSAMMGFIDSPAEGRTVGPVFGVTGWAAGRDGVDRVRIYLDDDLVATVPVTIPRPDVDKEFPRYASTGPVHGFGATIDAGSRAGYRALRIEAVDRRGALAYVASVNVKIEP